MKEQSKSAKRRFHNGNFHSKYFVGNGIDVGGAPDPLSNFVQIFSLMKSVRVWDLEDGDGQYLKTIDNDQYDFLHSSHCLEHMVDPYVALENWIRVVKPGGHLIITIPDEDMYEQGIWPSNKNADHKWTFTMYKENSWCEKSINVLHLLASVGSKAQVQKLELVTDFFYQNLKKGLDQTILPNTESAIEIILKVL